MKKILAILFVLVIVVMAVPMLVLADETEITEKNVTYENLISKNIPSEITTASGEILKTDNVKWDEEIISKTKTVTGSNTSQFAETLIFDEGITGGLVSVETVAINEPFEITAEFIGDIKGDYFVLSCGEKWLHDITSPKIEGYEHLLRKELNLDDSYTIEEGVWASNFVIEDSIMKREAIFKGTRITTQSKALYEATVYTATANYSNKGNAENGVNQQVKHGKKDTLMWSIFSGITAMMMSIIIIAITYKRAKKRN